MKTATTERPIAGQFPLRIALALWQLVIAEANTNAMRESIAAILEVHA